MSFATMKYKVWSVKPMINIFGFGDKKLKFLKRFM
jgi:hypothetical protein